MKKLFRFCFLPFIAVIFFAITVNAQPGIGEKSYNIILPGLNGDMVNLSSLRGKVVLIDFWASWCGPCRLSNRHLVKLYSKLKDQGFEIFGVSLDENKKDWAKAVKKDRISWMQVNDDGGWQAKTAIQWNIMQIPTSYLIDKDGRVAAIDLERSDLEKAVKQLLTE